MSKRKTLLLIDGIINLVLGIVLMIVPTTLVAFLGVPAIQHAFYPNILGGVLFGIGIALFLEAGNTEETTSGLGLSGAVAINLCGGLVLAAWLLLGDLDLPLQGTIFLWLLVMLLVGISAIEIVAGFADDHS
jgi:hypothetical protein